jgi:starvation-inducible DNA-binding protein
MFKTKNDLSEAIRAKAFELPNGRLADCIDLQTQTKQALWDVKGPNFIAPHELFDGINEDVGDYVDDIAERSVQLGGVAEETARMVVKRSTLRKYLAHAVGGHTHVDVFGAALAAFGTSICVTCSGQTHVRHTAVDGSGALAELRSRGSNYRPRSILLQIGLKPVG